MQKNVFQYKKVRIYYSNYPTCDWFLCPVRRDVHKICALQSRKDARNTHTRSQFEEERRVLLLRYLPSMFVAAVYIATRIMSTVSTPVTTNERRGREITIFSFIQTRKKTSAHCSPPALKQQNDFLFFRALELACRSLLQRHVACALREVRPFSSPSR